MSVVACVEDSSFGIRHKTSKTGDTASLECAQQTNKLIYFKNPTLLDKSLSAGSDWLFINNTTNGTFPKTLHMGIVPNPNAALAPAVTNSPGLSRKRIGTPKLPTQSASALGSLTDLTIPQSYSTLTENSVSKDSKYKFVEQDLETGQKLGAGTGGVVFKVRHKPTGILMARKVWF